MATILVVDDDAVDRELVHRCLDELEDLVDELKLLDAEDGQQALDVIEKEPPDLVLTDLRMPGMDGLELVTRLRDDHPLLPVILMTSHGNEQVAVKALKTGAASYVPKSDLKSDLAGTVQQVLEITEARRSEIGALRYLTHQETRFELDNDLSLLTPVVSHLRGNLEHLGFGNETIRTQVGMALMEALSNAIIHGNLEVNSEVRDNSISDYYRLIEERRNQTPYKKRRVRLTAQESLSQVDYVILDDGPGFDPSLIPDPTAPETLVRVRGRGLMLIRTFMDEVTHNQAGNEIRMAKRGGTPEGKV